jgi:hypothetical protein
MSEEHSCSTAICRRKRTSYNINVEFDIMCRKKRGECAIDIAHGIQIPEMMIHTILKSAQEIEPKAVNLLNHSKVKITHRRGDVMEVWEWSLKCGFKPSPRSREGCKLT